MSDYLPPPSASSRTSNPSRNVPGCTPDDLPDPHRAGSHRQRCRRGAGRFAKRFPWPSGPMASSRFLTTAAASRWKSTRKKASRRSNWSSASCTPAASSTRRNRATPTASRAACGVGVSVTNALSTRLEVEICVAASTRSFSPTVLRRRAAGLHGDWATQTPVRRVRISPDPKYFDSPRINPRRNWSICCAPGRADAQRHRRTGIEGQNRRSGATRTAWPTISAEMMVSQPVAPDFVGEKYVEVENGFSAEGATWALALVRGRRRQAGKLRQPDPDAGRRHPRRPG